VTGAETLVRDRPLPLGAKASLLLEIVSAYVRLRYAVRHSDVREVLARVRVDAGPEPRRPERAAARLARSVHKVCAYAPPKSRCLVESLVLAQLLARRGISSSVVIGVQASGDFAAHAWVELGQHRLLPSGDGSFEPLVRL
jgi:hypothetical protein